MNLDKAYASLPLFIRKRLKTFLMSLLKPKLKQFYSHAIKPNMLVYDIGAHDGDYTKIFQALGANVLCLEPNPASLVKLRQRFTQAKQITIIPYGVGAKKGKSDFYISTFNSPNSSFSEDFRKHSRYSYRTWDKVIKVTLTTLHDLIQQYGVPDFCKIDVEGYEWEVLSTLHKPIPLISFEFMTELNEKTFRIINHLETLGKPTYNLCLGMSYRYQLKNWLTGKELIELLQRHQTKLWNGDIYVKF